MGALELASGGVSWARVGASRVASRIGKALFVVAVASGQVLPVFDAYTRASNVAAGVMIGAWVAMLGAFVASFTLYFARSSNRARVTVDDGSLVVAYARRSRAVARTEIASVYAVDRPVAGGLVPTVEIALARGDLLTVRVDSAEQARALVLALGFGAGGRRVTIALDAPARRFYHLLLAVGAYQLGSLLALPFVLLGTMLAKDPAVELLTRGGSAVVGPAVLVVYTLLRRLLRPPTLTIGDDGVAYSAGLKRTFVPRAALASVEQPHPSAPLVLHTAGGAPVVVNASVLDPARRVAAGRVVYERLVAAPRGAEAPAAFERAGRSVTAWRMHLRGLFEAGGYREAGTSVDDAAAVLRSASATPEQRVGAALALRVAGEPCERIRVAAEGAADERVRVALAAVADAGEDDDAPLEKALKRLA
jgi:hypothetical protein